MNRHTSRQGGHSVARLALPAPAALGSGQLGPSPSACLVTPVLVNRPLEILDGLHGLCVRSSLVRIFD